MCQAELLDQPQQRPRLLQRVQIFALNVLDERHGDGGLVGHLADYRGNVRKPRHLCRAPPALAGDDFVALRFSRITMRQRPHQDRLHQTLRLDRIGELAQGFRAHVHARLILAPLQQIQGKVRQAVAGQWRRFRQRSACALRKQWTQLRKTTTQRGLFAGHSEVSPRSLELYGRGRGVVAANHLVGRR